MQCGKPAESLDVSSLAQSDQREAMEVGDSLSLSKSFHFKERPSFQV